MCCKTNAPGVKKLIILLSFFLFAFPVMAVDYNWQDLKGECFEIYSPIYDAGKETLRVNVFSQSSLLFVQNEEIIPYKYYQDSPDKYIDYKIIELNGSKQSVESQPKSINDNNLDTEFLFNTIDALPKNIILDSGSYMQRETFDLTLVYDNAGGVYEAQYFISDDGSNYVGVVNPESYSFRFLKISFDKTISDGKAYPLSIKELNIKTKGKKVLLVNSNGDARIDVFSNYRCNDNKVVSILNKLKKDSLLISFKIDANTPEFDLKFYENKKYNSDLDNDRVLNDIDNCPYLANSDQLDSDGDMLGDVCDLNSEVKNFNEKDRDKDGVGDSSDNCPSIYNPKQKDSNADKKGDLCADDDRDGYIGSKDNCVYVANRNQKDINANGIGDACEFDKDNDGVFDSIDNCVNLPNKNQLDIDKDDIGNLCDNCEIYNPQQLDKDRNGIGDKCEEKEEYIEKNDNDNDTILNYLDNCKEVKNFGQEDRDGDGVGDVCDNCLQIKNTDQKDSDENGVGDVCDDADGDGILGYLDNCPSISNTNQSDVDNDGVGDLCSDKDGDRVLAADDNCEYDYNPKQRDVDKDGIGDKCDDFDNRVVESNKTLFKVFIGVVTVIFSGLIFFMVNKMRKEEDGEVENTDNKDNNDNKLT